MISFLRSLFGSGAGFLAAASMSERLSLATLCILGKASLKWSFSGSPA